MFLELFVLFGIFSCNNGTSKKHLYVAALQLLAMMYLTSKTAKNLFMFIRMTY